MPHFIVYGEPYARSRGSFEPPEYGADVWEGEARNRREARTKAFGQWLRDGTDDQPWMQKVTIEGFERCPLHGEGECTTGRYGPADASGIHPFIGHDEDWTTS